MIIESLIKSFDYFINIYSFCVLHMSEKFSSGTENPKQTNNNFSVIESIIKSSSWFHDT